MVRKIGDVDGISIPAIVVISSAISSLLSEARRSRERMPHSCEIHHVNREMPTTANGQAYRRSPQHRRVARESGGRRGAVLPEPRNENGISQLGKGAAIAMVSAHWLSKHSDAQTHQHHTGDSIE